MDVARRPCHATFRPSIAVRLDVHFARLVFLDRGISDLAAESISGERNMSDKFDVALSYAGEDRKFVEAVARECEELGLRVFYDRRETDALWGRNLNGSLANIYENEAFFVVPFISHHYVSKYWTQKELAAALRTEAERGKEYILPARFDDSTVPGLDQAKADVDLRNMQPEALAAILAKTVGTFHKEEDRVRTTLSGGWSNEGNVHPQDTHRVEMEIEANGETLSGTLKSEGNGTATGLVTIDGRRYKRDLTFSILNASKDGIVEYGRVQAELSEGEGEKPTQLSWRLTHGLENFLPEETILYPTKADETSSPDRRPRKETGARKKGPLKKNC